MSWTNKERIPAQIDRGRLLSPNGDQILLGSAEDEVLIYQEETDLWTNKQRNS